MKSKCNKKVNNENFTRFIYFLFGIFGAAFTYNLVFVPSNTIVGGISGLAIIVKSLTGISTTTFINLANCILIAVGFIFLGKKGVIPQLFGSICFPFMVTVTEPIVKLITLNISSKTFLIIFGAILYGISTGIVYRAGFSTGGSDIVAQIISNRFKVPLTKVSGIILCMIIITGGIVFSPIKVMYAILVILISNNIANSILFSVCSNKMVYIVSKENKHIMQFISNDIHSDATEVKIQNKLFQDKKQMLMCIVHNTEYNKLKNYIYSVDPHAFVLTNKCYQVSGGRKSTLLPF